MNMYIFYLNTTDDQLTYVFNGESWGKGGNHGIGVHTFMSAMKKQFHGHSNRVTLTVMRGDGSYYNPKSNTYVWPPFDMKDVTIVLSEGK